MKNNKALFCLPVKNEEKTLKNFFKTVENIKNIFEDFFFIFVVSNCDDRSEYLIKNFLIKNKGIIIIKNFDENETRLLKIEKSRNIYLDFIKNDKYLSLFEYMIVMDVDGVNKLLNDDKLKRSLKNNIEWTALFPNQLYFYYDLFALRIKNLFENDCFEKIIDIHKKNRGKDIKQLFKINLLNKYSLINNMEDSLIKVNSAFGGLGIYKLKRVLSSKAKYCSDKGTTCEHISFNQSLDHYYGNLYIDKNLVNSTGLNMHIINAYLCSYSNYFAKRFLNKIK